jgi:hypothetical protein
MGKNIRRVVIVPQKICNKTRARLLRKLFIREDDLRRRLAAVEKARQQLGYDYWKAEGHLMRPRTESLRRAVFQEEL